MNYLDVANSGLMFALCLVPVCVIVLQALRFMAMAWKQGLEIGMDKEKLKKCITTSATISVIPALSLVSLMIAMSPNIGKFFPWLRLSNIGAGGYEPLAAGIGLEAAGFSEYTALTLGGFVVIMMVMNIGMSIAPVNTMLTLKGYDKAQIFEGYCDFLNYFDASIRVQLTFVNQRANMQDFARSIDIPIRGDEYDGIRREYGDMLKGQLQKGNNGLTKRKYITFGIEADDLRTAKMRLERIEADVLANFKALGAQAKPLDGLERLELLHSQLHPDGQEKFHFTWADLPKTGLSTKDFIAPSGLSFSNDGKTFRVADHSGAASFLQILAPELTDRLLAELLDLDDAVTVNLHIQSIDQAQAIKNIKRKMSDLQKMTIEEQKKAVRAGYDMDISATRS